MFMENSGKVNFLDNQSRMGEDELGLSQTNLQNAELNSYMMKNFYLQDCELSHGHQHHQKRFLALRNLLFLID